MRNSTHMNAYLNVFRQYPFIHIYGGGAGVYPRLLCLQRANLFTIMNTSSTGSHRRNSVDEGTHMGGYDICWLMEECRCIHNNFHKKKRVFGILFSRNLYRNYKLLEETFVKFSFLLFAKLRNFIGYHRIWIGSL